MIRIHFNDVFSFIQTISSSYSVLIMTVEILATTTVI